MSVAEAEPALAPSAGGGSGAPEASGAPPEQDAARAKIAVTRSIRLRLLAVGILLITLILATTGVLLSRYYRATTEGFFDNQINAWMVMLIADIVAYTEDATQEPGGLGDPRFNLPLSGWYWQIMRVTRRDGNAPIEERETIFASRSLSGGVLPLLGDEMRAPGRPAQKNASIPGADGRTLRLVERRIDLGQDGLYIVSVAGDLAELDEQKFAFDVSILVAFLALGLALAIVTVVQVRVGLAPLARLGRSLNAIRRGEQERISGAFPTEIAPIATELNLTLDANREIVERARTHVGNLAHALKTPLSVIFAEAELSGGPLAGKVTEQAELMRAQLQYYLDRARAAARVVTSLGSTPVTPVVQAFIRTFGKIQRARGIGFEAALGPDLVFRGEKQDLEEMLGNLVDNAGKWAKLRVVVGVEAVPAGRDGRRRLRILIDDDGPGLSPADRTQALRRGRRLDETTPGSGLGLAIVADLSHLYGGSLTLDVAPIGGLRAILELPAV
jgi:signal transduction histidine kinase